MSTLFVGNLPEDVKSKEVEDIFYKFGKIDSVNIRSKGKDTFAFVSFAHDSDAHEAMKRRDGYQFDRDHRMRVEVSKGSRRDDRERGDRGDRDRDYDRTDRYRDRDYDRRDNYGKDSYDRKDTWDRKDSYDRRDTYDRRDRRDYGDKYDNRGNNNRRERPTPKINDNYFKVVVENLPEGCSWQDLKDFIKKDHPSVKFTEVKDGKGLAGFELREEAEKVIEDLNNTSLRSRDGNETTVAMTLSMPEAREEPMAEARHHDREEKDVRDDRRSRSRSHSRD